MRPGPPDWGVDARCRWCGARPREAGRHYPADDLVPGALLLTRAISVRAPAALTWRWLCQVAVAPYSYDWIDNRGRRSPDTLTPGADQLELGQTMAMVFRLTSYDERSPVDGDHHAARPAALRPGRDHVRRRARRAGLDGSSVAWPRPPATRSPGPARTRWPGATS